MNFHDHLSSQSALHSLETGLSKMILAGGLVVGAILLAPVVLPALGIGGGIAATLAEECCTIVGTNSGVAGAISGAISNIPVIGSYLTTAGGKNILVPAVTILGGQAVGALVSQVEKGMGKKGNVGAFVRVTSMAAGVILALPAVLPGISHGVQFMSRLVGMGEVGNTIAKFLGNTHTCMSSAAGTGIAGGASALLAHLPCAIPAVAASFPLLAAGIKYDAGSKILPPEDANHFLTGTQQQWVEAYNGAAPHQKRLLQQRFRDMGFDPDFHPDGTMHLYKHGRAI
jgi:hypothetical protein